MPSKLSSAPPEPPRLDRVRYNCCMTEKVTGPRSYFPSIENKYGQPIQHWMDILVPHADKTHMQQVAVLKDEHGMGHGHANAIVHVFRAQ